MYKVKVRYKMNREGAKYATMELIPPKDADDPLKLDARVIHGNTWVEIQQSIGDWRKLYERLVQQYKSRPSDFIAPLSNEGSSDDIEWI